MAQPSWATEGSLGSFTPDKYLHTFVHAKPGDGATNVGYSVLNGILPEGCVLKPDGAIDGNPVAVLNDYTYTFTIRATDNLNQVADRTFTLTIIGSPKPSFTTPSGSILTLSDSTWVSYQLSYKQPTGVSYTNVSIYAGSLPPGLEMSNTGLIRGYANPPVAKNGDPTSRTYNFTVKLENNLGSTLQSFNISVINQSLSKAKGSRLPVVMNTKPPSFNIPVNDPYYGYYVESGDIGLVKSGNYFNFKIIGKDFDNDEIEYEFFNLPNGLNANSATGWITGIPTLSDVGISQYDFSVRLKKKFRPRVVSPMYRFNLKVSNGVSTKITWISNKSLGTIYNNTISDLSIQATGSHELNYRIVDGNPPPNLFLLKTGELAGKVANEVNEILSVKNQISTFTFTVEAFSPDYPLLSDKRTFTLKVKQYYTVPTENMYFKATPNFKDRAVIHSLLNNEKLIPTEYLYRPNDIYFGKAKEVKFVQVYGIKSSTIEKYISAIAKNHYWRNIVLGGIKTAVAKDELGNVIYEVVYSEVIDNLQNERGVSVSKRVILPAAVDITHGDNIDSRTDIYTSYELDINSDINYYNSLSRKLIYDVFPASFENMRKQIASVLEENYDSRLLPKWMSSQQTNGNILGFQMAWVICYTKPGYSEVIKNNIINTWGHTLNEINFVIDRYTVDKSSTYDLNDYLSKPSWENLPSATPSPDPIDSRDFYVLFPQKTILPK